MALLSASDFDRFLSANSSTPEWIMIHPCVWNGYWRVRKRPKIISKIFRCLGHSLKNRNLYWVGLSVYWIDGLKTYFPDASVQDIYNEHGHTIMIWRDDNIK